MKKWRFLRVFILLTLMVFACQLPTIFMPEIDVTDIAEPEIVVPEIGGTSFPATTTPVIIPSTELSLAGYGYTVKDLGNGWNEGSVYLALENKSDQLAGIEETLLPPAIVETNEGIDYDVTLGYMDIYSLFRESSQINAVPPIPPGFRVYATSHGNAGGYDLDATPLYATFRFAYAAHPVTITFPGTMYTIDLSTAQTNEIGYVGSESSIFQPISILYGQILVDEPNRVKVTISRCNIMDITYGVSPALILSIENRNKFQQTQTSVSVPTGVGIVSDGSVGSVNQTKDFIIGPGQTEEKAFELLNRSYGLNQTYTSYYIDLWPNGFIVFFDDSPRGYTIYTLNDCIYAR